MKKFFVVSLCVISLFFSMETTKAEDYKRGNGFESWLSDENGKTRDFESAYSRNGVFKVLMKDEKTFYHATQVNVQGWPDYKAKFYVPELKKNITKDEYLAAREISFYEAQEFVTLRSLNAYSEAFDLPAFDTGIDIPAGTYISSKQSLDMVEISYNGKNYWINPQYDGGDYQTKNYGYLKNTKEFLDVNQVNGIPIYQKIMSISADGRPGYKMKPMYITIHNTANEAKGADALTHANLQLKANRNYTSWHYTVDNKKIYQSIPMNETGWHAGDGFLMGNIATIGIEICENVDGNYAQAEKNAVYLTARLLYENGLPSDALRLHKDWSGKHCARNILDMTKGSMGWTAFKSKVKIEYDRIAEENKNDDPIEITEELPEPFVSLINDSNYLFEKGYLSGFSYQSKLSDIKDYLHQLDDTIEVEFQNMKGDVISLDQPVSTNQILVLKQGEWIAKMKIVIRGDTNGDGRIFATDYVIVKNHIMGKTKLEGVFLKAADIDRNNKIFATDYVMIKNFIMGKGTIQQ